MQAIILCGGKGTRLHALYSDRPKILVPIAGRPFVEWQLEWLARLGIKDVHLAGGYRADVLDQWIATRRAASEDGGRKRRRGGEFALRLSGFTFRASFSAEPAPLGTGGGLRFVEPWMRTDPVLVLNGDSLAPHLGLGSLVAAHQHSARPVTLAVTRVRGTGRYGTVEFDADHRITAFREKTERSEGWINAGIYVMDRRSIAGIAADRPLSIETDVFPALALKGLLGACPCPPPLLDMGTPEGIAAMESFLASQSAR